MFSLAGELADGVIPSWSSRSKWPGRGATLPRQRRGLVARPIQSSGSASFASVSTRMPKPPAAHSQARCCATALRGPVAEDRGYRGQFGRMGFDEVLTEWKTGAIAARRWPS